MMDYSKKAGKRELFETQAHQQSKEQEKDVSNDTIIVPPIAYTKGEGYRVVTKYFLLLEGETKEPRYITDLIHEPAFENIVIAYRSPANEKGKNMVTKMVGIVKNAVSDGWIVDGEGNKHEWIDIDVLYAIIDVDALEQDLANAVKLDLPLKWAISNPCFEIWLYYAYSSNPEELKLDEIADPLKRSSELKRLLPFTHDGGIDARKAFSQIHQAIDNSKEHYQLQANGLPALYSTQMHFFAEEVLLALQDSYDKWIEQRRLKNSFSHTIIKQ